MADLSIADIHQLYEGALFIRKGHLIKVAHVDGRVLSIYNLKTKKTEEVVFMADEYKPLANRIGMVNIGKSVLFLTRTTMRQYSLGITPHNSDIQSLPVDYPLGKAKTLALLKNFKAIEILYAYENQYPTLIQAYEKAQEYMGACAFDKQFAVDWNGGVFYKTNRVGKVGSGIILFDTGYEHLDILLENGYEKTSRAFKATPIRR